jgi:hypothetical protein
LDVSALKELGVHTLERRIQFMHELMDLRQRFNALSSPPTHQHCRFSQQPSELPKKSIARKTRRETVKVKAKIRPDIKTLSDVLQMACSSKARFDYQGYLYKRGGHAHWSWKRRYFILKDMALWYFKSSDLASKPLGLITLPSYSIVPAPDLNLEKGWFSFMATHEDARTYTFRAETAHEMRLWMNAMTQACMGLPIDLSTICGLDNQLTNNEASLQKALAHDDAPCLLTQTCSSRKGGVDERVFTPVCRQNYGSAAEYRHSDVTEMKKKSRFSFSLKKSRSASESVVSEKMLQRSRSGASFSSTEKDGLCSSPVPAPISPTSQTDLSSDSPTASQGQNVISDAERTKRIMEKVSRIGHNPLAGIHAVELKRVRPETPVDEPLSDANQQPSRLYVKTGFSFRRGLLSPAVTPPPESSDSAPDVSSPLRSPLIDEMQREMKQVLLRKRSTAAAALSSRVIPEQRSSLEYVLWINRLLFSSDSIMVVSATDKRFMAEVPVPRPPEHLSPVDALPVDLADGIVLLHLLFRLFSWLIVRQALSTTKESCETHRLDTTCLELGSVVHSFCDMYESLCIPRPTTRVQMMENLNMIWLMIRKEATPDLYARWERKGSVETVKPTKPQISLDDITPEGTISEEYVFMIYLF